MILKILTRHSPSYSSLIKYILKEGKDSQVIIHNLRSDNPEGYAKEFIINEAGRLHPRKGNTYMYHEIISMSANEDRTAITDEMLNDLAQKYISLRGRNGLFVGALHKDKDHIHIHFMTGGTQFRTGKAFRLSKIELKTLKVKFQEYHQEKYPELTESTVNHGSGKEYVTDKKWQMQHRDERNSIKAIIRQTVSDCFTNARSQQNFLSLLRDNNLQFYERNGKPTGIISGEMKIRFSRLDISKEQFMSLPNDRAEEEMALNAIQRIRTRNHELEKEQNNVHSK